jgi:SAM-dependent methyltransferase
MEWFDDDEFWRELYPLLASEERVAEAASQVGRLLALTRPSGKAVLDLGCGPGRWAIPLAKRGFIVTGLDRTRFFLKAAKRKARAAKLKIESVHADMRDFLRPNSFDLVLSMLTSFGYFEREEEDELVLRNIFTNLKSGGVCLIEVAGKEQIARIFQPTTSEALPDGGTLIQRHAIADDWSRMRNEWIFARNGRRKKFSFEHTIYSARELKERMANAGFKDVKAYGNLDGGEYDLNAQRLIVIGRKK